MHLICATHLLCGFVVCVKGGHAKVSYFPHLPAPRLSTSTSMALEGAFGLVVAIFLKFEDCLSGVLAGVTVQ